VARGSAQGLDRVQQRKEFAGSEPCPVKVSGLSCSPLPSGERGEESDRLTGHGYQGVLPATPGASRQHSEEHPQSVVTFDSFRRMGKCPCTSPPERFAVPIPSTHISLLCDLRADNRQDRAWTVFHARYRGVIFGWCLRRGLSSEGAEDLTQDVLLKLFQQLPRYSHDPARGQFRGWLKAVVNNTLTDFWRRQRQRPDQGPIGGTTFLERLG